MQVTSEQRREAESDEDYQKRRAGDLAEIGKAEERLRVARERVEERLRMNEGWR